MVWNGWRGVRGGMQVVIETNGQEVLPVVGFAYDV